MKNIIKKKEKIPYNNGFKIIKVCVVIVAML